MWMAIILLVLFIPILAIVLDSQLGRALAARLERDSLPRDDGGLSRRVATLESEVERLGQQVERMSDENEFLRRLLEKRPADGGLLPPGDEA